MINPNPSATADKSPAERAAIKIWRLYLPPSETEAAKTEFEHIVSTINEALTAERAEAKENIRRLDICTELLRDILIWDGILPHSKTRIRNVLEAAKYNSDEKEKGVGDV